MPHLPEDFVRETRLVMGDERFNRYLEAFSEEAPTSIRLNPKQGDGSFVRQKNRPPVPQQVPWCEEGFYLEGRPQFTFDPLFHAGCYYVQEAASMFVSHVLRHTPLLLPPFKGENLRGLSPSIKGKNMRDLPPSVKEENLRDLSPSTKGENMRVAMLDMCAAPGGKSTAAISVLPKGSTLVCNEPIPTRAQILLENITKWGWPDCIVTNNYPRDFRKAKAKFDVILCDVPCSGEGMFRKDPQTISEWSQQNVEKCWRLQREIVADAWECLNPGGILIYSTCTFNTKENEENVRWIMETYDAEVLEVPTEPEWHITGSLLEGFEAPVYRFIPGITKGEGLFMAVLRRRGAVPRVRSAANHKETVPSVLKHLTSDLPQGDFPRADLSYQDALRYLRGEALVLPTDTPRGIITVTYKGRPLGPVKNIGNRANNLYPKPWRIKTTHLPTEPVEIVKLSNSKIVK